MVLELKPIIPYLIPEGSIKLIIQCMTFSTVSIKRHFGVKVEVVTCPFP